MNSDNNKYSSSVKLVDSLLLAREISKATLLREYSDRLNGEFYEKDHNGVEKIGSDGEKIFNDRAIYLQFHLYTYYLDIIQKHIEPLPLEISIDPQEIQNTKEVETKDPNFIIKWIRDFFNIF